MKVAYDGTNYCGWQTQINGITIEEVLNKTLSEFLKEDIVVIGASRTDSGVHALGNVAVFDTETKIPADKMAFPLNERLPEDIRIVKSKEVKADFHPRKCNCTKTYEYKILNRRFALPTERLYSTFMYVPLDVKKMQEACSYIIGEHDFKSFCSSGSQVKTTVRTIYDLTVKKSGDMITIRISGNGFLYNMVRIIAGTLVKVGMGVYPPEHVAEIIEAKDRGMAGQKIAAHGLTLVDIDYNGYEDMEKKDLSVEINKILMESVMHGVIAGGNVLILKDGKEIAYAEAGHANVEQLKPFKRDTITRMYSMTKPVTSLMAMILMERGILDVEQAVEDILPSFKNLKVWENGEKVPAKTKLRIKHLLSMTSGISYGGFDEAGLEISHVLDEVYERLYSENPMTTLEVADKIGDCGMTFNPGEKFMYGLSADVLGAIMEKLTGKNLGELMEEEIFKPLGMKDTGFFVKSEDKDRLADAYESTENGIKLFETNHLGIRYHMDCPPAFCSGGAGLVSTIDDYSKFAMMLMNEGTYEGVRILKPETVRFMISGALTNKQKKMWWDGWQAMSGNNYGNLIRIMEKPAVAGHKAWSGEYGWSGWLGTYFCNSESNKITILLTCQKQETTTREVEIALRKLLAENL